MGVKVQRGPRINYGELREAGGLGKPAGKIRPPIVAHRNGLAVREGLKPRSDDYDRKHGEDFGPQAEACRTMPCAACGWTPGPGQECDAHHEPPRSLGGKDKDTVPLGPSPARDGRGWGCGCHEQRGETTPEAFWGAVGLDPEDVKEAVRDFMRSPAYPAHLARLRGLQTD